MCILFSKICMKTATQIKFDEGLSDQINLRRDDKQVGLCASYNRYINDLSDIFHISCDHAVFLYADEFILFLKSKRAFMIALIGKLYVYCQDWKLNIDINKWYLSLGKKNFATSLYWQRSIAKCHFIVRLSRYLNSNNLMFLSFFQ